MAFELLKLWRTLGITAYDIVLLSFFASTTARRTRGGYSVCVHVFCGGERSVSQLHPEQLPTY